MEDKQVLKNIANTLTQAPIHEMDVVVRVQAKRSLWSRLTDWKHKPELIRHLVFHEAVVANQIRIAGEAALLPDAIFQDNSFNVGLVAENMPRIIYMIACALQNDHKEPDTALVQFLTNNLTGSQLRDALVASFQSLNMEAFTDSIILMKGTVKILMPEEMSPTEGSELIASHIATS
jgi:hypothetical protein